MSVINSAEQAMHAFFDAIRPIEDGYRNDTFAFVAVKHLGVFTLLQGHIVRGTGNPLAPMRFETEMVLAGCFALAELGLSAEIFAKRALIGSVPTPMGDLRFPPGEAGRYAAQYEPFHKAGLAAQQRLNVLRLDGARVDGYVDVTAIDWHLRAADEPYHGLEDLLLSLRLGVLRDHLNVEAIAFQVALVDAETYVSGTLAHIKVRLVNSLDPERIKLGYRVIHQGNTVARASLKGDAFCWKQHDGYQAGHTQIHVPPAAVVQCFASFNGTAQHYYWIIDPTTSQNPRRAIFMTFDPSLSLLQDFLSRQGKGQNARDLELGVAWLLWLLGFSTVVLGGTAKTQDFADVIAATPEGHLVIVECTTGLLKADNKLPLLIQRTHSVREKVELSEHRHLRILPVLVTSRTRDEVRADLEQAERLGILVITKEHLEGALPRTLTAPNPDAWFREAEELVRANIARLRIDDGSP